MSTANFSVPNTKKHYCIFNDNEDYWHYFFEDDLEEFTKKLLNKLRELSEYKKYEKVDFYFTDNVYYGFNIRRDERVLLNMEVVAYDREGDTITNYIAFVIENGYYEGVMFNYYVERSEYNYKYVDNFIDRVIDIYEEELEKFTTHKLKRVAQFSNGETIYASY